MVHEGFVVTACQFAILFHVMFDNSRQLCIVGVGSFFFLEENIRVLCCSTQARCIWSQSAVTEGLNCIHINQTGDIFVIIGFNLLNLMRGTEAVEEVDKRNPPLNS